MSLVIETKGLQVEGFPDCEITLAAYAGELVSLLFAHAEPSLGFLRAMAGLERCAAGSVSLPSAARVAMSAPNAALSDLPADASLVLLHATGAKLEDTAWSPLVARGEGGAAIVIATTDFDDAFRCPRAVFVGFTPAAVIRGLEEVCDRIEPQMRELLRRLKGDTTSRGVRELAAVLLAQNRGARGFLVELRRHVLDVVDRQAAARVKAKLAGVMLDDRLLARLAGATT